MYKLTNSQSKCKIKKKDFHTTLMPVSTSVLVRMYLENMREEQLIVGEKYLVGFKKKNYF